LIHLDRYATRNLSGVRSRCSRSTINHNLVHSILLPSEPHSGFHLDTEGWADIDSLTACAKRHGQPIDKAIVHAVVETNKKKRFAISDDCRRIRAVQGHSTSIREQGLKAGSRHHVHLSLDISTAIAVGKRYGKPVVLEIQASKMSRNGFKFFRAENDVWLTDAVPPQFINIID
jgi:putative RNA 2'-phosphotransferase